MAMMPKLFILICGIFSLLYTGIYGFNCARRTRKSFNALSTEELRLYKTAIAKSMDQGYYALFVELHTNLRSQQVAHSRCTFVLWHNCLLFGFENMLRSLGPEFACITVPYLDHVMQSTRQMTGTCSSIEDCDDSIDELGGLPVTLSSVSVNINGRRVEGNYCANKFPLNHFCQAVDIPKSKCVGCVPRTSSNRAYPTSASFASVYQQLFSSTDYDIFTSNIEGGLHNGMHSAYGGTMELFEAPADLLFWSHHAAIGLYAQIFYKCNYEEEDAARVQFCDLDSTSGSRIIMETGRAGNRSLSVFHPSNKLYPFFQTLPQSYRSYITIQSKGVFSFAYEMQGPASELYLKCRGAMWSNSPASRHLQQGHQSNPSDDTSREKSPPAVGVLSPHNLDEADQNAINLMNAWIIEIIQVLENRQHLSRKRFMAIPSTETMDEIMKMVCMFQDKCRGGVRDYSESFKANFRIESQPACKVVVDAVRVKKIRIALPDWKQRMEKYFPC